jgi:hypothetical protein
MSIEHCDSPRDNIVPSTQCAGVSNDPPLVSSWCEIFRKLNVPSMTQNLATSLHKRQGQAREKAIRADLHSN